MKSMGMLRWLVPALLVAFPATGQASPDAACWLTKNSTIEHWSSSKTIPVYVGTSSTNGVQVANYSTSFVDRQTQIAIARWNEQSGTSIHLKWAGELNASSKTGAILITGNAPTCSDKQGSGVPTAKNTTITAGTVTLYRLVGPACSAFWADMATAEPGNFADVLVHEIGHTLGRNDAYAGLSTDCTTDSPNTCGKAHNTIMCRLTQDLTEFDRTDHQAVYGNRTTTTTLMFQSMTYPGTTYTNPLPDASDAWDVAPGPGASYQFTDIPVTLIRLYSAVTDILVHNVNYHGWWTGDYTLTGSYYPRKPVSAAYGPDGSGVMAYVVEQGWDRKLCYRTKSGVDWSGETCTTGCGPQRNSISTAFDPASGRFLVTYQCVDSSINVTALQQPGCGTAPCQEVSTTVSGIEAAETPVVACGNSNTTLSGTTYFYSNCRLVYAKRNVARQPVVWRMFGVVPDLPIIGPPGPPSLWASEEFPTGAESDHAPAVAWFVDRFRIALSFDDSQIDTYSQTPSQQGWLWTGTINPGAPNAPAWISPPFLSATRYGSNGSYNDVLYMYWFKYTVPPCTISGTPSPCAGP